MTRLKCDYCGDIHESPRCFKRIQLDILQAVSGLGKLILEPDAIDHIGINNHLRAVWGFRDWVNSYFEQMQADSFTPGEPNQ